MPMTRAIGLHVVWAFGMALSWLVFAAISGDLTRAGWWSLLAIPLLILAAAVTLPINLAIARVLAVASAISPVAVAVILGAAAIGWFSIGWFYLAQAVAPQAWVSGAWTGIGGLVYGVSVVAVVRREDSRLSTVSDTPAR